MKVSNKSILMGVIAVGILTISSCAPMYKCGDPMPEKQKGGKRLQAVVSERDSLCMALADQKMANDRLTTDNRALQNRLSGQENINENQSEQLSQKNRDLQNKERMLREMQAIIARQNEMTRKLNETLRGALVGFSPDELTMEIRDGKVYVSMSDKLLFKSGSAAVEPKGVEALQALADVLNKNPDIQILVEGHTDNVPIKTAIYKDNWDLSVGRATSITRLLNEKYAVAATRMTASGRGEYYPRATNETQEGKAMNRRTEIILSPKLDEIMNLLNNAEAGN
ncbi:MAG: flagellar motor protein MotB [Candidatus Fluviicola riflensis]|nr:MAG: flagellar motor protein MotB [Candidatus Fluviicola riflensis]OGS80121.1 MAG: flagellar motor protein MotB [Candidatus Fluviicola riflensis]OGS82574.1 MAG: flagellar motor protein MotB [Fluviicola sp. RIFCSPHIGHO2_01_FULL_43_53]OGS88237.1 MAG: flagellar motor protein MotB [Fluviicola sp. RIFCSPHIGHO2_12_FULL_43_24]